MDIVGDSNGGYASMINLYDITFEIMQDCTQKILFWLSLFSSMSLISWRSSSTSRTPYERCLYVLYII
ncbi:hypothetical protein GQ457_04G011380 [Hibiscus cannabinus]